MHQDPEHEDYDDDEYNYYPEYIDHGNSDHFSNKFNIDWVAWEKWLSEAISSIVEDTNLWDVNNHKNKYSKKLSTNKMTQGGKNKDNYSVYIGNNNYDETVWKYQYFVSNKMEREYKNYLASNASYILQQPNYYRSMFENLN